MRKYPQFVMFLIKFNRMFKKKYLSYIIRKKKKIGVALLFSWITFVIIVIQLDLTEKVTG